MDPTRFANGDIESSSRTHPNAPLRFLIIGAGARGNAYAHALLLSTPDAVITAVAEPVDSKREAFGRKYIWGNSIPESCQSFVDWRDLIQWEREEKEPVNLYKRPLVADGVFICTLDETHVEIITAIAPLGYHVMSEKPLATTLQDCLKIYRSLQPPGSPNPEVIFSIGHVLHYSPHNILLRKLLLEQEVIGDILSIEHTEPVGWWHFSHSYVRGNWRKESITAPSLLTKSCHDIDLLLWLLCTPPVSTLQRPHLPSSVTSTGSVVNFKQSRKPSNAGNSTNCYSCPTEPECLYSAKKIYVEEHLAKGIASWPVNIVDPEIEDMCTRGREDSAIERLEMRLKEDYTIPDLSTNKRSWYGRCVYEAHNDVCDDQIVTITWEDDPLPSNLCHSLQNRLHGRGAKNAVFHMAASTEKQCERRGRVYGTRGEIEYDSKTIRVYDFGTKQAQAHYPHQPGGGHGGGDVGLALAFFHAVRDVKRRGKDVKEAQQNHIGCTLEEIIRSHAMVFAAEEARRERKVIAWPEWWQANVETMMADPNGKAIQN